MKHLQTPAIDVSLPTSLPYYFTYNWWILAFLKSINTKWMQTTLAGILTKHQGWKYAE